MSLVTRRGILRGLSAAAMSGAATATYAVGIEPARLRVQRYRIGLPPPWPIKLSLKVAALADIHACEPWMSVERIGAIVDRTNALGADLVVMLGDFVSGQRFVTRYVDAVEWAPVLAGLRAPLGVHAVLGNHDWWEDRSAMARRAGPTIAGAALERVGIRVLENDAVPLTHGGHRIWLGGLGDQIAFEPVFRRTRRGPFGRDDLGKLLAGIPETEPAILLAHEPDIFPRVPARVGLTLSGHTHGGQIRLLGWSPVVPSRYRNRYAYGHVREHTNLVVSGGLGCSIAPVRFGVPPEIVLIDLHGASA